MAPMRRKSPEGARRSAEKSSATSVSAAPRPAPAWKLATAVCQMRTCGKRGIEKLASIATIGAKPMPTSEDPSRSSPYADCAAPPSSSHASAPDASPSQTSRAGKLRAGPA